MEETYAQALATIRDANTSFTDYSKALCLVADFLVEQYVSQIEICGHKVLVVSAVCDFDTFALPVGEALARRGAHVSGACIWFEHHSSPFGDFCDTGKSFFERQADERTHVIIVSSVAHNASELEGMTILALDGDEGEVRPASLSIIAAVAGNDVRGDYFAADLFENEPPTRRVWLQGETVADLAPSLPVTPAMARQGLTTIKHIDFPPYVKAKMQELIRWDAFMDQRGLSLVKASYRMLTICCMTLRKWIVKSELTVIKPTSNS
jgi:hypothetical protein